jgi:hypothetical protein
MSGRRILRWHNLGEPDPEDGSGRPGDPSPSSPERPIDFGAKAGSLGLVGCFDPLDGTVLEAGQTVVVCRSCGTGYHESSWAFIAKHNHGACCNCKRTSDLSREVLGGAPVVATVPVRKEPGVVLLDDLKGHVGRIILFEGRVLGHQVSQKTGTHFVKFHGDSNPFKGFKLVIFQGNLHKWERLGFDPASYEGATIRVRGLLVDHPSYGLEILPFSPAQIEILP